MNGDDYTTCYWSTNCSECAPDCIDRCDFFTPIRDDIDAISLGMNDEELSDFRTEWWDYLYRFYNER